MNLDFGNVVLDANVIHEHCSIEHMWIHLRNYTKLCQTQEIIICYA
jgi:hypothetical protein